jgi:hypothetical protein
VAAVAAVSTAVVVEVVSTVGVAGHIAAAEAVGLIVAGAADIEEAALTEAGARLAVAGLIVAETSAGDRRDATDRAAAHTAGSAHRAA